MSSRRNSELIERSTLPDAQQFVAAAGATASMLARNGSPPSTASSRKSSQSLADSDRTLLQQQLHDVSLASTVKLEEGLPGWTEDVANANESWLWSKDKLVVVLAYLAASTASQLAVISVARRSAWPTAVSAISAEAVLGFIGSAVWNRTQSNGFSHGRQYRRRDLLVLGLAVLSASVSNVLQAGQTQTRIWAMLQPFASPILAILLPLFGLSCLARSSLFSQLLSTALALVTILLAVLFGSISGLSPGLLLPLVMEAAKLILLKDWFNKTQNSPAQAFSNLYYILPAVSAPLLFVRFFASTFSPVPWHWVRHAILFGILGLLDKYATLRALAIIESPMTLAQMAPVRALIVFSFMRATDEALSHCLLFAVSIVVGAASLYAARQAACAEDRDGRDAQDDLKRPISSSTGSKTARWLAVAALGPLLLATSSHYAPAATWQRQISPATMQEGSVDIVISSYDEPAENVKAHINKLKEYWWIGGNEPRVIIYLKGNISLPDPEQYRKQVGADVAIHLDNKGREAGTFLQHIVDNYNASLDTSASTAYRTGFADHTLFMQHHLAWDWIARERLWLFKPNTGYLHFAPYVKLDCGKDMDGNGDFPKIAQIFSMFREELCPPTLQLGAYAAQFVVSKKRILANPYSKYKALLDVITAEADHWIHQEGTWWHYHGAPGPENPYFGHAMERSWPIIFGCTDPAIKDTCKDVAKDNTSIDSCQCLD